MLSLRAGGVFLTLAGVALWTGRYRLERILSQIWSDWIRDLLDLSSSFRKWGAAQSRAHLILLCLVILAGICIRAIYLNQTMRYDEAYTYLQYASKSLFYAIAVDYEPNNHWFHTLLVWLAVRLFGHSPAIIRLTRFRGWCFADSCDVLVLGQALAPVRRSFGCQPCGYKRGHDYVLDQCPRLYLGRSVIPRPDVSCASTGERTWPGGPVGDIRCAGRAQHVYNSNCGLRISDLHPYRNCRAAKENARSGIRIPRHHSGSCRIRAYNCGILLANRSGFRVLLDFRKQIYSTE